MEEGFRLIVVLVMKIQWDLDFRVLHQMEIFVRDWGDSEVKMISAVNNLMGLVEAEGMNLISLINRGLLQIVIGSNSDGNNIINNMTSNTTIRSINVVSSEADRLEAKTGSIRRPCDWGWKARYGRGAGRESVEGPRPHRVAWHDRRGASPASPKPQRGTN